MKDFTVREKRKCRRHFYHACSIWSLGNSFAGTIPVFLVLNQFGKLPWGSAAMFAFSGPIVGRICRVIAPLCFGSQTDLRNRTMFLYAMQAVLLAGAFVCVLPAGARFLPENWIVLFFLGAWYLSNVFENLACVTMLAWTGKLFPKQVLGRFYALRERWLILGEVCVMVVSGFCLNAIRELFFQGQFPLEIQRYIYPSFLLAGGLLIGASLIFLRGIPALPKTSPAEMPVSILSRQFLRKPFKPLKDPIFRWAVIYGILFAFCTQMELPTRNRFHDLLLAGDGIYLICLTSAMSILTRGGQLFVTAAAGRWVDRFGTLPVMACSQILTAFALLFYVKAAIFPNIPMLFAAAAVWISYAGLNVGLPKFLVEYSDRGDVSWPAAYGCLSGFSGLAGSFFGKEILEYGEGLPHYYSTVFLCFFVFRLLLCLPLFAAHRTAKKIRLERSASHAEERSSSR